VANTGRGRLTLVTALTVASLLLGSSAINALADGRGGGDGHGHGGGQANADHAQQLGRHDGQGPGADNNGPAQFAADKQHPQPAAASNSNGNGNGNGNGHGNDSDNHTATSTTTTSSTSTSNAPSPDADHHGNGNGQDQANKHDDEASATTTTTTTTPAVTSDDAANSSDDVERDDAGENDLVTPPGRVTEEQRPGLGCGDAEDHSGPPGNPDKTCNHPHDNDSDASTAMTAGTSGDDTAATNTDSSVASDDSSGD